MIGVFIHVPKTGGKSLVKSLGPYFKRVHGRHSNALEVYQDSSFTNLPFIMAVRNPWERVASLYRYTKSIGIHKMDWDKWLHNPVVNGKYIHFSDVEGSNRNPLTLASYALDLEGNELIDTYLEFSRLGEEVKMLSNKYSVPVKMKRFKHPTDGKGKNYTSFYTEEQRGYIAEVCEWEIEKFNYTFE